MMFTGNDFQFPVEMFIALMDQSSSNGLGEGDTSENDKKIVENALSHIPNLDTSDTNNRHKDFPASAWKQQHLNRLRKLSWEKLKQELVSEFGLKREYNLHEKLELLFSIGKGASETQDNFLLRIQMVVCCIEHGKMRNTQKQVNEPINRMATPSEIWVELLCVVGLLNGPQNIPFLSNTPPEIPSRSRSAVSSETKDVVNNEINHMAPIFVKKYTDGSAQCTSLNSEDMSYQNECDEKFRASPVEDRIFHHLLRTEDNVENFADPSFSIQEDVEANGRSNRVR